jgi:lysosomal acid lipase/cholesteryl ester hydrolase
MINIPFFGRLSLADYVRIILTYTFLVLEPMLRLIFAVLPLRWVIDKIYNQLKELLQENRSSTECNNLSSAANKVESFFLRLHTTDAFADYWGFPFQTHFVTSKDGYILALHRIPFSRSEHLERKSRARQGGGKEQTTIKPVVLLWHGCLMSSEVWVATPNMNESLAFTLAEAGFDVWLGNTRGNKYSCKHRKFKPSEEIFWDFSMDQFAHFDLPDSIDYILNLTGVTSLSFIGFSQGSAIGFSALSLNSELNRKVNLFVALAPATKPLGSTY